MKGGEALTWFMGRRGKVYRINTGCETRGEAGRRTCHGGGGGVLNDIDNRLQGYAAAARPTLGHDGPAKMRMYK